MGRSSEGLVEASHSGWHSLQFPPGLLQLRLWGTLLVVGVPLAWMGVALDRMGVALARMGVALSVSS